MQQFAHLSLHTEYSVIDSTIRIDQLAEQAEQRGITAIAITDKLNMHAASKFYAGMREKGIKPIFGVDFDIEDENENAGSAIALAQDQEGLRTLRKLLSVAYQNENSFRQLPLDRLLTENKGLIVLSGGTDGLVGRSLLEGKDDEAETLANRFKNAFGDRFFLEISRVGKTSEDLYISKVVPLAEACQIPLVATNDVRFLNQEDFAMHETRYCIANRHRVGDGSHTEKYSNQQYFRSAEEMSGVFADFSDAFKNANEIALRCSAELKPGDYLPQYVTPDERTPEVLLDEISTKNLDEVLEHKREIGVTDINREAYVARLEYELEVIKEMGFAGYFLIVKDIVSWAKANKIPVGPGRGSGSASLVAYLLGITGIDPIEHDLMFERLLNRERVSLPDFDIDFCMNRRDEVLRYVAEVHGEHAVGQIVSFGSLMAKAAIRDVTRVHGKPHSMGTRIVDLIPDRLNITLNEAISEVEALNALIHSDDDVREIVSRALDLEGLVRNLSKHAGGLVIAPSALDEYVPIFKESPQGELITQFDKDDVEKIGLVKFDFLGLKTVTAIALACEAINQQRSELGKDALHPDDIPLDDAEVFEQLRDIHTIGLFQLESHGMRRVLKELQPDSLEDIIALVSLFRPGPLQSGVVDQFVHRKNGEEKVEYLHPLLERVLSKTYGVMVYQEDVMTVARELAGFSLGDSDRLRRAMGKKQESEMLELREQFINGCEQNDVSKSLAGRIYDDMEKFAEYAFNRAHATGYAVIALQTAYLKVHYPTEFMAALLTCDMTNREDVNNLIAEAKRLNLEVVKPNLNKGEWNFKGRDGRVEIGLGMIKGLGLGQAQEILDARQDGDFESIFDLCERAGLYNRSRNLLQALIHSGSLDCLCEESDLRFARATLLANVDVATGMAEQKAKQAEQRFDDLFGEPDESDVEIPEPDVPRITMSEMLSNEEETLGFYVTGHPMSEYRDELKTLCTHQNLSVLQDAKTKSPISIGGIVRNVNVRVARSGNRNAQFALDDEHGSVEINLFGNDYENVKEELKEGTFRIIQCDIQKDRSSDETVIRAKSISPIDRLRVARNAKILIDVSEEARSGFIEKLQETLESFDRGSGCEIIVNYGRGEYAASIALGAAWRVSPTEEVLHDLALAFGDDSVRVSYSAG